MVTISGNPKLPRLGPAGDRGQSRADGAEAPGSEEFLGDTRLAQGAAGWGATWATWLLAWLCRMANEMLNDGLPMG